MQAIWRVPAFGGLAGAAWAVLFLILFAVAQNDPPVEGVLLPGASVAALLTVGAAWLVFRRTSS